MGNEMGEVRRQSAAIWFAACERKLADLRDGLNIHHVSAPRFSLVVPIFNEAGNLRPLLEQAVAVLRSLPGEFEALLVDDGSTDDTPAELDAIAGMEPRCRVIRLARNRGQAAALYEGLQQARGEMILTMDGDGQNDPDDFPALLARLERGPLDVVCGIRTPRRDSLTRRAISWLANRVRGRILRDRLHDAGCQLRVFRREVIAALQPSPLLQTFLPAMAAAAGFRLAEMPVRHHPRRHGISKYGLRRLWWRPAVEMIRLGIQLRRRRRQR
jgi:dolichol-phosphate mannosyltransferase